MWCSSKNAKVLVQLSQDGVLSLACGRRLGFGKAVKHFRCGRSPGTSNGFSHDGHKVEALIDACATGVAVLALVVLVGTVCRGRVVQRPGDNRAAQS